jgi:hypothetical protein
MVRHGILAVLAAICPSSGRLEWTMPRQSNRETVLKLDRNFAERSETIEDYSMQIAQKRPNLPNRGALGEAHVL